MPISGDLCAKVHTHCKLWKNISESVMAILGLVNLCYCWLHQNRSDEIKRADGNGQKTFVLVFLCAPCLHTALLKREPEFRTHQNGKADHHEFHPTCIQGVSVALHELFGDAIIKIPLSQKRAGVGMNRNACLRVDYIAIIYISVRCTSWQEVDLLSTRLTKEDMSPKSI